MEKILQAGFAKVKITPDFPVSLSGYGGEKNRFWTDVVEDLFATCIAVTDSVKTLLIFTVDTCGLLQAHQEEFRLAIEEETGVSAEGIYFGATHCHNGCSMYPTGMPEAKQFTALVKEKVILGAKEALADLAPASLFAGMPKIPGMNYTRHYLAEGGKRYSANMGFDKEAKLIGHVTANDDSMSMVKFQREGKQDIFMMNWQAHPDSAYGIGFTSIAPGWVGKVRDTVEEMTGMLVAYFTGTGGNEVSNSKIASEHHGLDWKGYGKRLGEMAVERLDALAPVENFEIRCAREWVTLPYNHEGDAMVPLAKEVEELSARGKKEEAAALMKEYGFSSASHMGATKMRADLPAETKLELGAFAIGDVAFVTNTLETFANQGLFVKENSPFPHNFIITSSRGYIATAEAYDYVAYEVLGWSAYYARGAAEKMALAWVNMLQKLR